MLRYLIKAKKQVFRKSHIFAEHENEYIWELSDNIKLVYMFVFIILEQQHC